MAPRKKSKDALADSNVMLIQESDLLDVGSWTATSLPNELWRHIVSEYDLVRLDLKALRLTSRGLYDLVTPFVFSEIKIEM